MEQKEKEWVESEAKKYATPTMLRYGNVDAAFIAGADAYATRISEVLLSYANLTASLAQENADLRKQINSMNSPSPQ